MKLMHACFGAVNNGVQPLPAITVRPFLNAHQHVSVFWSTGSRNVEYIKYTSVHNVLCNCGVMTQILPHIFREVLEQTAVYSKFTLYQLKYLFLFRVFNITCN